MQLDKKLLRQQLIKKRSELDGPTHQRLSSRIISHLKQQDFFQQANTIAVYLSYNNEVDTWQLIREMMPYKRICVPTVDNSQTMHFVFLDDLKHLKKNKYGIYEPVSNLAVEKTDIDLIIVPLVGFNDQNFRLGYGGGYYDRFLAQYSGKKIGIAFQLQRTEELIPETFDVPLDMIITE